ncbi:Cytochrome c oxidase subunit 4, mitochondrial [Hypsizygus marmoreus]|uniref:Cytochrome c oxidase subunit 4, mitochondrial n=1 Tax=Hypsizygus marmoreus TaxID=39966 RepID=A0A369JYI8_HYPMA|nr:Cytochrome c oxidase subunit 4, mitochondrial [Hypsizygus marmoreus]
MFRTAVRTARPAALAARSSFKPKAPSSLRALHTTLRVASAGHGPAPPQLYGEGGKAGEVPSDIEQATGLERLQLLGELEGVNVFDDSPLDASRIGTKANPILVPSYDVERLVGCTGSPADSHDVLWFNVKQDKQGRCTECGSVYALDNAASNLGEHTHA